MALKLAHNFATHSRHENFLSNEIAIYMYLYNIFFTIGDFPIQFFIFASCHTPRILSLGSLCEIPLSIKQGFLCNKVIFLLPCLVKSSLDEKD